jgi:hypothetical protein
MGEVIKVSLNRFERSKTFQSDLTNCPDPEGRRAATDHVFRRVPLMLALSCEMPKQGDYKAKHAVGLTSLIARDRHPRIGEPEECYVKEAWDVIRVGDNMPFGPRRGAAWELTDVNGV